MDEEDYNEELLDENATAAMQSLLIGQPLTVSASQICKRAYEIAAAMLRAKENRTAIGVLDED